MTRRRCALCAAPYTLAWLSLAAGGERWRALIKASAQALAVNGAAFAFGYRLRLGRTRLAASCKVTFFGTLDERSVTPAALATYAMMRRVSPAIVMTVDGELALKARPGFLAWVSVLVHHHRQRLLSYACRRGLSAEDALDVVQDSFMSFLRLPEAETIAHDGDDALRLLTVIVRHNLQNQLRKQRRHGRARAVLEAEAARLDDESSESLIARAEELARVKGCILRMADLQRQVVLLSLLDEQPRDEVAKLLGVSGGYVRVLLHRAREHVRVCPYDPE